MTGFVLQGHINNKFVCVYRNNVIIHFFVYLSVNLTDALIIPITSCHMTPLAGAARRAIRAGKACGISP